VDSTEPVDGVEKKRRLLLIGCVDPSPARRAIDKLSSSRAIQGLEFIHVFIVPCEGLVRTPFRLPQVDDAEDTFFLEFKVGGSNIADTDDHAATYHAYEMYDVTPTCDVNVRGRSDNVRGVDNVRKRGYPLRERKKSCGIYDTTKWCV
jgi:hypothetical protein